MSPRTFARTVALVAAGSALLAPRALHAQQYVQQLQTQMNTHTRSVLSNGYTPVTSMVTGNLQNSSTGTHQVTVTAGRQYVVVGVCDNDCSDLDLKLYSPDNNMVVQDIATDDYPTLQFTAAFSGQYRLEVIMATCRVNPCYYGVQLFGGASGAAMNQPAPMNAPMPMNQPQPLVTNAATLPMLGMIGANQQVMGNLAMQPSAFDGKPIQTWGFQCTAGQTFQMDILSSWDNYAIVFDPNGMNVAHDDDTGDGTNARVMYTCQVSGVFRLAITTYSTSISAGPYTLQVQSAAVPSQPMNQPMPMNQPAPMAPQPMTQAAAMPLPGAAGVTLPQPSSTGLPITGSVAAPGQVTALNIGESRMGRLETGDQRMNDGTWADVWTFQGRQGQRVRIEARSEEFDTYLQLLDAQGSRLAEDDDSLGDQNSLIEYVLPTSGTFTIVVNNFGDDRKSGIYTLTIR